MAIDHSELAGLDATRCAALVRAGELTPLELVDAAIDRAEQVNGTLNAIVTRMYDHARETARTHSGAGIFAGVPFLVKDFLAEVEGVRFTEASAFLADHVPAEDSELVRRFRAAGLVFIGKTNTPELAIGPTTEPRLFGPTRNPWDTERTAGGSSGGSAAAVAARVAPMAHGNDAGGSIRIPASCCGLVGLKPSRGRVSLGPHYGDMWSGLVCELGVTRTVRDTAALLDAVAGPAAGEPYFPAPPARSYTAEAERSPGSLKVGFSVESPLGDAVDPECERAVRSAAALCESLGHEVEEARPDCEAEALWTKFTTLLSAGAAWAVADWERRTGRTAGPQHFEPFVWAFAERGRALGAHDYLLAVQDMQRGVRDLSAYFDRFDLWLTATLGQPPVELGTLVYRGGDPFELRRRCAQFSPYTWIANASGQPAISVPLHWSPSGLPIGVHFVARWGEEAALIRLAGQLERARPWEDRRPGICAT